MAEADTKGQSIREMAEQDADDAQEEIFPRGQLEGDDKSIRDFFQPHHRIELTASLMAAEVPASGGLVDPEKEGMALVTYELSKPIPVPIREGNAGEKELVGWKIRQQLRPVYVEAVRGEEGAIEANFAALLAAEPNRAGALLDRLVHRAGRALQ